MIDDQDTALELVARVRHAEGVIAVWDRLAVGDANADDRPLGRRQQAAAASW
jgi:hypothetical protein